MITLAAAKLYCRIDHNEDDTVLERMIAAASEHFASIGVDVTLEPQRPSLQQAILMLVAHWYDNREAVSDVKTFAVEIGVDRLIQPYREVSL
jgi:uncharacterized phage protein (predicted DNA packaging)